MHPHASESLTEVGYCCGFLYLCLNKAKAQASGIKWSLMPMCSIFFLNNCFLILFVNVVKIDLEEPNLHE